MDFTPYTEFFNHDWQALLDDVPADWSWDRKACYLYLTATEGNTTMAKAPSTTPRKPGRRPAQNQTAAILGVALDFLGVVPNKSDNPNWIVINGPIITVNNGLIKAGIMAGESFPSDAVAKINMSALSGALASVGKEMEVTFGDESVSISSGTFRAELENMPILPDVDIARPDERIAPLNNEFRDALSRVMKLVSDTGEELMTTTIAVTGDTVIATRRTAIIEAFHGNSMPPAGYIYLPKGFAQALAKTKANVSGFGFGPTSFTVHFENGAYLQTNTYPNAWNVEGREPGIAHTAAVGLLTADIAGTSIDDLAAFKSHLASIALITGADVYATLGKLRSVDGQVSLDAKEIPCEFVLKQSYFAPVADLVTVLHVARDASPPRLMLWGDKVRGCVIIDAELSQTMGDAPAPAPEVTATPQWGAPPAGWANPQPAPSGASVPASAPTPTPAPAAAPAPITGESAASPSSATFSFPPSTADDGWN